MDADIALAVGDRVQVALPQYRQPFKGAVVELHIWWKPLNEYFAHPDSAEAELTHKQISDRPRDFQVVVRDDNGLWHFVPVTKVRRI